MKEIKLTQGKKVIVDDIDFEELNKLKWYAHKGRGTFYAVRRSDIIDGKLTSVRMHRFIVNAPVGMYVDHIDGNGLNNRRSNLRIVTNSENMQNRGKQKNNKSGYKGVSLHRGGKWTARIKIKDRYVHLGLFETKIEAHNAYQDAGKKNHRGFSKLK